MLKWISILILFLIFLFFFSKKFPLKSNFLSLFDKLSSNNIILTSKIFFIVNPFRLLKKNSHSVFIGSNKIKLFYLKKYWFSKF